MLGQIGFHFVGPFTEADCNQYFGILNDTKPGCITVLGAAQFDQALRFAKTCKQTYPEMRVIFRHFINKSNPRAMIVFEPQAQDTGRHARMSDELWWEMVGKLYIGTGLTVLTDNESTMSDYTPYSAWQAAVLRLAGENGVGIAYGRFPAFHPAKGKEQQLDAMLIEAGKWGNLHTYSPNLYWSAENTDAFKYPYYVIQYAAKLGITLETTIGEYALLRDIRDAHHGWRSCNISGKAFAYDAIIKAKVHLPGIPVCIYSIGQWPIGADTFSLDKDALDTIKANLTELSPVVKPPTLPPLEPPIVIVPPPTLPNTVPLPRAFVEGEIAILDKQIAECKATLDALTARRDVFMKSLEVKAA